MGTPPTNSHEAILTGRLGCVDFDFKQCILRILGPTLSLLILLHHRSEARYFQRT